MSKFLVLESFHVQPSVASEENKEEQEEARLAAYEQGFQAGWDDCVVANEQEQTRISDELAANLAKISLNYQDIRNAMLKSIEPVFQQATAKVLSGVAYENLGDLVVEQFNLLAAKACDIPIEIVANQQNLVKIERRIGDNTNVPWRLQEEPTLGEGQVYLRMGTQEKHIDLGAALNEISAAIQNYFEMNDKERAHG